MFLVSNASRSVFRVPRSVFCVPCSVFCVPCSVFRVNVTLDGFYINSLNIYRLYQPIN